MRTVLLFLLINILCPFSKAEILNGFARELQRFQSALDYLDAELADPLIEKKSERDFLKLKKQFLQEQGKTLKLFQRTEEIIRDFREVSPGIANQVNNLRDADGMVTDVYVLADYHLGIRNGIRGVTNIGFNERNRNTYASRFGDHTVEVRINGGPMALMLLAHEFGHVIYQVPNIKSYLVFYQDHYKNKPGAKGHHANDPSHHSVLAVMNRFYEDYSVRLSQDGIIAKLSRSISSPVKQFLSGGEQTSLTTNSNQIAVESDQVTDKEVSKDIH